MQSSDNSVDSEEIQRMMDEERIPEHVAIIMDGNGRWAQGQGKPRIKGHEAGAKTVREAIRTCRKLGVKYLTLYAFSVENWVRPKAEVKALMALLKYFLKENAAELHDNQVRLRMVGRREDLPKDVLKAMEKMEAETAHYESGTLLLALSYGGRTEIVNAVQQLAQKVADGKLAPDAIDEQSIREHLYASDVPDPDLIIRTSGEMRLSNFLLWQCSYSEFYCTPTYWPDFHEAEFCDAICDYGQRKRRYGGLKAK